MKFAELCMEYEESVGMRARNNTPAKRMKIDPIRYDPFSTQPASQWFFLDGGDLD